MPGARGPQFAAAAVTLQSTLPLPFCLIFPIYRLWAAQCLSFHRSSPSGLRGQCKIGPAPAVGPGWPWVVEWESGFLCVCSALGVFAFLRLIPEVEVGSRVPLPCTCRGPSPPACLKVAGEELPAEGIGSACPNMQVEQRPECDMRLAAAGRRQSFLLSELGQNQVRAFSERNKSWQQTGWG